MVARIDPHRLRELAEWRPARGVITVCLEIDPADRSEGWRTALRNGLKRLVEEAHGSDRERWMAMKPTAEAILERFPEGSPHPSGRSQIGFVEVAARSRQARWYPLQLPLGRTEIVWWDRPHLGPLVELLDDGAPLGAVAVSSERVRLLEWALGECQELAEWEPEFRKRDWRERRAQRPEPARPGTSASGRDQIGQRLDANRERFLRECAERIAEPMRSRGWRTVMAFGNPHQVEVIAAGLRPLAAGLEPSDPLYRAEEKDVIGESTGQIARRIEAILPELNRTRELELVRQAEGAAHAEGGAASLGRDETLHALQEGRVAHLLFDPAVELDSDVPLPHWGTGNGGAAAAAAMIEQALRTGAWVTPVEGEAAEALRRHEGVAALLRY